MSKLTYILRLLFDLLIAFRAETCLNPFKWLAAMFVRVCIIYALCIYGDQFPSYFQMDEGSSIGALCYDLFLIVPLCLFVLWWAFTSLIMFLSVLYYRPGARTNSADYSEISRFIEWRDNAMKYMSYPDAQKLMQASALLNNLDKSSPEARLQLDRINNAMKFMSYTEALDFLRGK